jgi:predicted DsbA family dithiol-disulfide isomerase
VRAERLERELDIDLEWQPYELHPEIPPEGIDRGGLSLRRTGLYQRLQEIVEEAGLAFEPQTRIPNSHLSLEAAEFAREQGAFASYHRALFAAFFGEGRDIGDVAVLKEMGEASGLDAAALEEALESKHYASLVDERTVEAKRSGVTGTPTFVFQAGERQFPIVGAQEYAVFEDVARRMGAPPRAG